MKHFEIEQKYRLRSPGFTRKVLKRLGARMVFRKKEVNDIWDFEGRFLTRGTVLRLRRYGRQRSGLLTCKGPRVAGQYKKRLETELSVDCGKMSDILSWLGFERVAYYEKKREEYVIGKCHVTLDHISGAGWFLEIEGSPSQIHSLARKLGLSDTDHEDRSYLELYRQANGSKRKRSL